jgi:hypothetical protein
VQTQPARIEDPLAEPEAEALSWINLASARSPENPADQTINTSKGEELARKIANSLHN